MALKTIIMTEICNIVYYFLLLLVSALYLVYCLEWDKLKEWE